MNRTTVAAAAQPIPTPSPLSPLPAQGAMPSTEGLNFYTCDPALDFVLRHRLSADDYQRALPHLHELGALAAGELDHLATEANRQPPVLRHVDRRGEIVDEIDFHPSYRAMQRLAYERFGLAALVHREGVLGWPRPAPQLVKYALAYLFAHAEFGLLCPVSVTDHSARMLEHYADEALATAYLPGLTRTDLDTLVQGTMWLTERNGGSDVGATETVARQDADGVWRLNGDKWFCSVADGDLALTLARPLGAAAGTRGLAMFLVPLRLPDGRRNGITLNRLKEKFGSLSMATGEVSFHDAAGYAVGPLDHGFRQMAEMINVSRLSNAMRAAGIMRRAYLESLVHARGRLSFGRPLSDLPLLRETLLSMLVDVEGALALVLHGAALLDRADAGDGEARRLLRLLTPLAKAHICKRARWVTGEAMEVRGGNGYVDDWPNARLVRDSFLGSIWEGTTNIVVLDAGRAIERDGCDAALFADLDSRLAALRDPLARRLAAVLARLIALSRGQTSRLRGLEGAEHDLFLQRLAARLFHLLTASLLLEQGDQQAIEEGHSYRTLLVAAEYVRRYLVTDGGDLPDLTALRRFDELADWRPLPAAALQPLLTALGG